MLDNIIPQVTAGGKALALVLAYLGGIYGLWERRIRRPQLARAAETDKLIAQYAQQFAENPDAHRFFEDLQLQRALERLLGFAPMPSEFAAIFRFYREEQASLRDLRLAWPHRRPSADGRVSLDPGLLARIFLWLQRLYAVGCFLSGGIVILPIFFPPFPGPSQALVDLGLGFAMIFCAILPFYAGQSELAVQRIEYRRRLQAKLPPPPDDAPSPPSTP